LKDSTESQERMSIGSLFHARGPATENALSPNLVHILRTRRSPFVAAVIVQLQQLPDT